MKDIHLPVRTLFYTIITGKNIMCYENGAIPDDASTPYINIISIDVQENSNKTDFGNTVQILIDIVTAYPRNELAGSKQVDLIAAEILEVINSKIKFEIFDGLQIVNTKIMQDQKLSDQSDTHRIYRRLIRFQQLIMEV